MRFVSSAPWLIGALAVVSLLATACSIGRDASSREPRREALVLWFAPTASGTGYGREAVEFLRALESALLLRSETSPTAAEAAVTPASHDAFGGNFDACGADTQAQAERVRVVDFGSEHHGDQASYDASYSASDTALLQDAMLSAEATVRRLQYPTTKAWLAAGTGGHTPPRSPLGAFIGLEGALAARFSPRRRSSTSRDEYAIALCGDHDDAGKPLPAPPVVVTVCHSGPGMWAAPFAQYDPTTACPLPLPHSRLLAALSPPAEEATPTSEATVFETAVSFVASEIDEVCAFEEARRRRRRRGAAAEDAGTAITGGSSAFGDAVGEALRRRRNDDDLGDPRRVSAAAKRLAAQWVNLSTADRGQVSIGRTMFESDRVPLAWVPRLAFMDALWVPTPFHLEAFARTIATYRDLLRRHILHHAGNDDEPSTSFSSSSGGGCSATAAAAGAGMPTILRDAFVRSFDDELLTPLLQLATAVVPPCWPVDRAWPLEAAAAVGGRTEVAAALDECLARMPVDVLPETISVEHWGGAAGEAAPSADGEGSHHHQEQQLARHDSLLQALADERVEVSRGAETAAALDVAAECAGTRFLSVFKWERRKGWDVLAEAFAEAFFASSNSSGEGTLPPPCLIIKTSKWEANDSEDEDEPGDGDGDDGRWLDAAYGESALGYYRVLRRHLLETRYSARNLAKLRRRVAQRDAASSLLSVGSVISRAGCLESDVAILDELMPADGPASVVQERTPGTTPQQRAVRLLQRQLRHAREAQADRVLLAQLSARGLDDAAVVATVASSVERAFRRVAQSGKRRLKKMNEGGTDDPAGSASSFSSSAPPPPVPRILVLPQRLTDAEMRELYVSVDVLVQPTRGEGWGRPQQEAMALGIPVITTNWSAPPHYMAGDGSDGWLIPVVGTVAQAAGDLRGHHFAEPDVGALVGLLRRVHRMPPAARREIGQRARARTARDFGPQRIGRDVVELSEAAVARKLGRGGAAP